MNNNDKTSGNNFEVKLFFSIVGIAILISFMNSIFSGSKSHWKYEPKAPNFIHILSSYENSFIEDDLKRFANQNDIRIQVTYMGDIDIVDELNTNPKEYDAVWISNSMWLYMLNNSYLYSEQKSISISPVIFGIKKSKAESLGLVGKDVTNNDIVKLIQDKKISYVMSSVTRTNTGATAYFGFVQSLAGNPEVLTIEHLQNKELQENLKAIFSGVERVSGDEDYLKKMFLNDNKFEAVIADEGALIEINKELVKQGKEPLYFIYPTDGVAMNDSTFSFISANHDKKDAFIKLQDYLLSEDGRKVLDSKGKRTWYGGVKEDVDKSVFNPAWGIDTTKSLLVTKFPSKNVMNEALNVYVNLLRKPTHVAFCLDYSGSMSGTRITELKDAMGYILDSEQTAKERLQFTENDKVTVIMFETKVGTINTKAGNKTDELLRSINANYPSGATALFPCVEAASRYLEKDKDDVTKVVIAMTDGEANVGSFGDLENYYNKSSAKIPVYSIAFGDASEYQLDQMSDLTNGKTFNGKTGLLQAFKEVRGYN